MVLLDNKTRAGVAGYEVVMPLRIAGSSMHVLVNRGWIAAGRDRARLPDIRTPDVLVDVVGMARIPGRFLELAPVDEAATGMAEPDHRTLCARPKNRRAAGSRGAEQCDRRRAAAQRDAS